MLGRKVLVLVGATTLLASTCAIAAPKANPLPTGVAAIVNGEKITKMQLSNTISKWYGPQGIEEMILIRLVDREAKKAGVVVTNAQVKAKIDEIDKRASAGGTSFVDYLKQSGKTLDYASAMIRMDLQANAVLRKTTKVTSDELAGYRKVSHILIMNTNAEPTPADASKTPEDLDKASKDKIEQIAKELKSGLSFEKAAKEYSQDPMNKDKGGDLDWFTKSPMGPEFEKAAFALKAVGDVSEPVKTRYGYHIIKLTGLGNEVTGADKKKLEDQILQSKINVRAWVMQLRQDAKIQSDLVAKRLPMPTRKQGGNLTPMPMKMQRQRNPMPAGAQAPPPPPPAPSAPAQTK